MHARGNPNKDQGGIPSEERMLRKEASRRQWLLRGVLLLLVLPLLLLETLIDLLLVLTPIDSL